MLLDAPGPRRQLIEETLPYQSRSVFAVVITHLDGYIFNILKFTVCH
jgi:hypothetical protein